MSSHLLQRRQANKWGKENDEALKKAVKNYGTQWSCVSTCIPGKNSKQCRLRWHELNPQGSLAPHTKLQEKFKPAIDMSSLISQTKTKLKPATDNIKYGLTSLTTTAPLKSSLKTKIPTSITIDVGSPITPVESQEILKATLPNKPRKIPEAVAKAIAKPEKIFRSSLFHPSSSVKSTPNPCKRSSPDVLDNPTCKKFRFEDIDFSADGLSGYEMSPRSNINWTTVFFGSSNEKTSYEYQSILDRSTSPHADLERCHKNFPYTCKDESFLYRNEHLSPATSRELKLDMLSSRAASSPRFGQYDSRLTVTSGPFLTPSKSKTVDPEAYRDIGFITQDKMLDLPENVFASIYSNPEQKARHRTILHNLLITDAVTSSTLAIVC